MIRQDTTRHDTPGHDRAGRRWSRTPRRECALVPRATRHEQLSGAQPGVGFFFSALASATMCGEAKRKKKKAGKQNQESNTSLYCASRATDPLGQNGAPVVVRHGAVQEPVKQVVAGVGPAAQRPVAVALPLGDERRPHADELGRGGAVRAHACQGQRKHQAQHVRCVCVLVCVCRCVWAAVAAGATPGRRPHRRWCSVCPLRPSTHQRKSRGMAKVGPGRKAACAWTG